MSAWTIVIRDDFYLQHFVNMLEDYKGNAEQRSCALSVIAQIKEQMPTAERPLVVIDAEDREQVERMTEQYKTEFYRRSTLDEPASTNLEERATAMQAALRSLLAPPKPDEPTGDGAVVECRYDGKRGRAVRLGGSWTFCGESLRDHGAIYDDFTAVRVLSEGVAE